MSKKKIIFVSPITYAGGAEKVLINLIRHLDKEKYDISLVVFENNHNYHANLWKNVNTICLNKKSRWDFFKLILKLRKIIRTYHPNVVLSFLHYTNIVVFLAKLISRRECKILISERSYYRTYLDTLRLKHLRKWLMRFTYKRADTIIAVSKSIKNAFIEDFNIDSGMIKTIYNPLPLDEIISKSKEKIEHPFYYDTNAQVIICVGRLVMVKRYDRILKSFSMVKNKLQRVYLILVGDGELRDELEKLAFKLKINKWVDFVGFKSNPYPWMAKADIFVLSSDLEGFPNVILEAMACSTPVISTDCLSGPNEIINSGENGILVQLDDEQALADAMITLLRNKDLRMRISRKGKKRIEKFKIENILPQYEELF